MKWVTREGPKTDRIACPWLIRNFIDPDAEFLYVPADQVLEVAEREGAHSYDAPNAQYTHRDGLCSFEVRQHLRRDVAPKPFDVAKELVHVTRPGGRIVMGNWIP